MTDSWWLPDVLGDKAGEVGPPDADVEPVDPEPGQDDPAASGTWSLDDDVSADPAPAEPSGALSADELAHLEAASDDPLLRALVERLRAADGDQPA